MKTIRLKDSFDIKRFPPIKSKLYQDKFFSYDKEKYGRLDITLEGNNPDEKLIICYQITKEGDIDFNNSYSIPLNTINETFISCNH